MSASINRLHSVIPKYRSINNITVMTFVLIHMNPRLIFVTICYVGFYETQSFNCFSVSLKKKRPEKIFRKQFT